METSSNEQLQCKTKSELVAMVVEYQNAENIRKQWNEMCRTVEFQLNQLTSDDMRELEILAIPYCHSPLEAYIADSECSDDTIVKGECDSRSKAEKLYQAIDDWASHNNVFYCQAAIL